MIPLIRSLAAAPSDGLSAADGRRLLVSLQGPQAIALDGPDCARSCSCGQKGGVGRFQYPVQKLFHADPEWEAYQPIAD